LDPAGKAAMGAPGEMAAALTPPQPLWAALPVLPQNQAGLAADMVAAAEVEAAAKATWTSLVWSAVPVGATTPIYRQKRAGMAGIMQTNMSPYSSQASTEMPFAVVVVALAMAAEKVVVEALAGVVYTEGMTA